MGGFGWQDRTGSIILDLAGSPLQIPIPWDRICA
jgi:hypothetical protein